LALTERDGVLTLPALYSGLNEMIALDDSFIKGIGFDLADSQFEVCRRVEAQLNTLRESSGSDGTGLQGALSELARAFAPLSDPHLMASVSPPFEFDFDDLTREDPAYQVYMMVPAEYVSGWSGIVKALLVNAMLSKARKPQAPRQVWLLDEAAQACQNFPLLTQLFTYGAGIGITPWAVFQSLDQLKLVSPSAETIIPASAQLKIFFAIRELSSATTISRMIGTETLRYDDDLKQARARHARRQAVWDMLNGADPMEATMRAAHQAKAQAHRTSQSRQLMTEAEVMALPQDKMLLFTDAVPHVILADRRPYWTVRWMASKYHPNPFHPPLDRVRVQTWLGPRTRWVCKAPVEPAFADYPQYADGFRSRITKERPTSCPNPSPPATPTSPVAASAPMPAQETTSDPSNETP